MYSDGTQANGHMTAPTEALTTMVTSNMVPSSSSLGKRRRERYETYCYGLPQLTAIAVRRMTQVCRRRAGQTRPGFLGEQSPQKGLVVPLSPGPKQQSTINPRRRGAERGGSRPRQREEFTVNPCRGIVSRRGRWGLSCQDSRLGSRRERWKCSTTREARRRSKSSYKARRLSKTGIFTQFPRGCRPGSG
jgi:hypothetical protein